MSVLQEASINQAGQLVPKGASMYIQPTRIVVAWADVMCEQLSMCIAPRGWEESHLTLSIHT